MCPAHWGGVGYWRGEHLRAAPHSRALCSAACSRAESPRSPACIFRAAAACARPFPCPGPGRGGFRLGAPRQEAFLPSQLPIASRVWVRAGTGGRGTDRFLGGSLEVYARFACCPSVLTVCSEAKWVNHWVITVVIVSRFAQNKVH